MSKLRTRTGAFTLVELLVVIGIIAILIGIILPALAGARRQGVSVKCKASLHQIGDAFKMYAVDNKGWWPIVMYGAHPATIAPGDVKARSWQDFLFPYLHKGTALPIGMFPNPTNPSVTELRSDLAKLRGQSPLWGCQAFRADEYFNPGDPIAHYSTGYGMNYYTTAPYPSFGYTVVNPGVTELCYYDQSGTVRGRFYKGTVWNKNGANRLVIADANEFWIFTSSAQHYKSNFSCEPFWDRTLNGTFVRIDGARHLSPRGLTLKTMLKQKGTNVLFADGHVDMLGPFECYNATMGGGYDILAP